MQILSSRLISFREISQRLGPFLQPHIDPDPKHLERRGGYGSRCQPGTHQLDIVPADYDESAVDNFALSLFQTLRYTSGHRVAVTCKEIPFFMYGEWQRAKADICLSNRLQNNITLLVQENKGFGEGLHTHGDAEAQLIAQAIAAF